MENNVFAMPEPSTGPMTFEDAKKILNSCTRYESRDHSFGDREIYWTREDVEVAEGYFGGGDADVFILIPEQKVFRGEQARELAKCGAIVHIGRNDETGPDNYRGA
jgi:hypothetical protein